jgi:hypothetical protein
MRDTSKCIWSTFLSGSSGTQQNGDTSQKCLHTRLGRFGRFVLLCETFTRRISSRDTQKCNTAKNQKLAQSNMKRKFL